MSKNRSAAEEKREKLIRKQQKENRCYNSGGGGGRWWVEIKYWRYSLSCDLDMTFSTQSALVTASGGGRPRLSLYVLLELNTCVIWKGNLYNILTTIYTLSTKYTYCYSRGLWSKLELVQIKRLPVKLQLTVLLLIQQLRLLEFWYMYIYIAQ